MNRNYGWRNGLDVGVTASVVSRGCGKALKRLLLPFDNGLRRFEGSLRRDHLPPGRRPCGLGIGVTGGFTLACGRNGARPSHRRAL